MSTNTSIGSEPDRGGNDNPGNADGCGNKTLGSHATESAPTGAGPAEQAPPAARQRDAAPAKLPKDR